LGESAAGGEQKSAVLRVFRQQAFHQLKAEGQGFAHQVGVVVGGESGSAAGQGIAELVDGDFLEGASGGCERK
jgi:hypothetical protein